MGFHLDDNFSPHILHLWESVCLSGRTNEQWITSTHRIRKSVRRNLWGLKACISLVIVYCIFVEGVNVAFHSPIFTWKKRFRNFTCWPGWRLWMACFSLALSTMILKTEPKVGNLRNMYVGNISGSTHKGSLSDLLSCQFVSQHYTFGIYDHKDLWNEFKIHKRKAFFCNRCIHRMRKYRLTLPRYCTEAFQFHPKQRCTTYLYRPWKCEQSSEGKKEQETII